MRFLTARAEAPPGRRRPGTREEVADRFDHLYTQYLDSVFSYVLFRVPNRTEAEDITAETFAAALTALPRFQGHSKPYTWLISIARHKIAEANRQRDRQRELPSRALSVRQREMLALLLTADLQQVPEDALLQEEARQVMRQLLEQLPEPQREALLLQVRYGLSYKEIGEVLGRSEDAVCSMLQRARATIFRYGQNYFKG